MNALFNLATHPEYAQPMREEVKAVINEEVWTKSSTSKLRKVDSFLRESQRLSGNSACMYCAFLQLLQCFFTWLPVTVRRKVLKDFTFSNGTIIPAGCMIGIPHRSVHCGLVRVQPSWTIPESSYFGRTTTLILEPSTDSGTRK